MTEGKEILKSSTYLKIVVACVVVEAHYGGTVVSFYTQFHLFCRPYVQLFHHENLNISCKNA